MYKIRFLLFAFLFVSCENIFFGDDENVFVEKNVSDFNTIIVNDIFDIKLTQDTINRIFIEGAENIVANIKVFVKNDSLYIENNTDFRWTGNYDRVMVNISVKDLQNLRLNAPSDVVSTNNIKGHYLNVKAIAEMSEINISMDTDNFYFVNQGTSGGNFNFSGNTINLGFWIRGSGKINTEELTCKSAIIKSSTIADTYISVENKLKVEIERDAKIFYKGNPEIIAEDSNTLNNLVKLD
ncbi:MAG: head GIN domain-containing protein [Bacteroidota bacterium]|nr:head GIN domain-containing protein [Bacteroidota bacterium]